MMSSNENLNSNPNKKILGCEKDKIIQVNKPTLDENVDEDEDDALYLNQIDKFESSIIETKTPSKINKSTFENLNQDEEFLTEIPPSPDIETVPKSLIKNEYEGEDVDDNDIINSLMDASEKQTFSALNNIKTETEFEDNEDETLEENKIYVSVLKKYFGHNSFRPLQLNIIKNVLEKKIDQLICMATGKGKSLCYQLPSLCVEKGMTIVISPLISLMEDQVMALKLVHIEACLMGSAQDQRDDTFREIFEGKYKILYLTPEFLQENVSFLEKINDQIGNFIFIVFCMD
jgi:hypothetical protein